MELQKASEILLCRPRPLISLIERAVQGRTASQTAIPRCRNSEPRQSTRAYTLSSRRLQEPSRPTRSRPGQQGSPPDLMTIFGKRASQVQTQRSQVAGPQISTPRRAEAEPRASNTSTTASQSTDAGSSSSARKKDNDGIGSSFEDLVGSLTPKTPVIRPRGHRNQETLSIADQIGIRYSGKPPPQQLGPTSIRLNPSLGRTVYVNMDHGRDLARSFRMVDTLVARDGIKRDLFRQRFHERPGTKKKRLRGERWRRRFKEGFQGMVSRVQAMRKMGW